MSSFWKKSKKTPATTTTTTDPSRYNHQQYQQGYGYNYQGTHPPFSSPEEFFCDVPESTMPIDHSMGNLLGPIPDDIYSYGTGFQQDGCTAPARSQWSNYQGSTAQSSRSNTHAGTSASTSSNPSSSVRRSSRIQQRHEEGKLPLYYYGKCFP